MKTSNLNGLRILNTRPYEQGKALSIAIANANGRALSCPALEILFSEATWFSALPKFDEVHQAIFISVNAVTFSCRVFAEQKLTWPAHIHVIAVGNGTAKALQDHHIRVDAIPIRSDSEHLLLLNSLQAVHKKTILLFKGEGGRRLIAETLKERGAKVIELDVYQRVLPTGDQEKLESWWREDAVDIILFTSQEAMQNIFTLFGEKAHAWLQSKPCLVISQRLAEAASQAGIQKIMVCNVDTIMETLNLFNKGLIHGKEQKRADRDKY